VGIDYLQCLLGADNSLYRFPRNIEVYCWYETRQRLYCDQVVGRGGDHWCAGRSRDTDVQRLNPNAKIKATQENHGRIIDMAMAILLDPQVGYQVRCYADLTGANLSSAYLHGADLS